MREGVTMMDFRNVEWKLNRPDLIAVASDWGRTTIATVKSLDAGLTAAVDALRKTHVNGGAQVAQFSVDAGPAVRWALSRNGWNEFDLFGRFFRHQAVVEALPAVAAIKPSISAFQMEGTFTAYGRLADWIMSGGAYERFAGSDEEALDLAKGFARAAFDFRFSETFTWVNWMPWTDWFQDVAWDGTFLWFDARTGIVTVLLITDTD